MNELDNAYGTPAPVAFDADEAEVSVQKTYSSRFSFLTGAAGTGKTHTLKERRKQGEKILFCATTGVAAVNLGETTLNSALGFFDTESLADHYAHGGLVRKLVSIGQQYELIAVDEVSMMPAEQLDILTLAVKDANDRLPDEKSLGVVLTGDFAQLAPVKAKWAFEAQTWPLYAANTLKLTKIWRQSDQPFLDALNLARAGKGAEAAEALRSLVTWIAGLDTKFDGTTIVAKNDEVERINSLHYIQLPGKEKLFRSGRWGKQRGEWKIIPPALPLKIGAFVMILSNMHGGDKLQYANGDQGHIEDFAENGIYVRLKRKELNEETGKEEQKLVLVPYITRFNESKEAPATIEKWNAELSETVRVYKPNEDGTEPYYDETRKKYVYGAVTYLPVRLAYAATVHKTQGLTLDAVQIDPRGHFFGSANMAYVALSRVKSPSGLKIVGTPEMLARRIKIAQEVLPWV